MQWFDLMIWMSTLALTVSSASTASGQNYPNKSIRIVTSGVGGGSDFDARLVARGISGPLGQQVIVDNRPAGVIQGEILAKAPPDGYTLLVAGGTVWIFPLLQKTPYDPIKDFLPITVIEEAVSVLAVHPSLPAKSVKEFIALARAKPGELNYASGGTGSSSHLSPALFTYMAGINVVHVPYKGNGAALTALLGNQVQMVVTSGTVVAPHIKSGQLRALGVTSASPSALFPELPAVSATVPGYESVSITGIFAPAKTPVPIINRLNQEIVRFLRTSEAKETFLSRGAEAVGSSPEQLGTAVKAEMARLDKVIKVAGIKPD